MDAQIKSVKKILNTERITVRDDHFIATTKTEIARYKIIELIGSGLETIKRSGSGITLKFSKNSKN